MKKEKTWKKRSALLRTSYIALVSTVSVPFTVFADDAVAVSANNVGNFNDTGMLYLSQQFSDCVKNYPHNQITVHLV